MVDTATVTDAVLAAKTGFVHEIEKVVVFVRAEVVWDPAVARVPDNAPPPVHVVVFCEDQLRETELPDRMAVESAVRVAVGAFHAVTFTLADAEPPAPEHVTEYVAVCGTPSVWEPDVPTEPLHPPDSVQVAAFVDAHVRVTDPFVATSVADAFSETVGAGKGGGGVDEPLPPPPPPHAERIKAQEYSEVVRAL